MRRKRCVSCDQLIDPDRLYPTENGLVCDSCESDDRMEPGATVFYGNGDEPHTIGSYHNDTEGVFTIRWHSTDGWRGYYVVESDEYQLVHDDCILSYSEDAEALHDFDAKLREYCDTHEIEYARVFTRTSNVFSGGYDFFVKKDDIPKIEDFMNLYAAVSDLNRKYRDPERFAMTALTGKSGDFDEQDKLLVRAFERLQSGDDPDDVVTDIRAEVNKIGQR